MSDNYWDDRDFIFDPEDIRRASAQLDRVLSSVPITDDSVHAPFSAYDVLSVEDAEEVSNLILEMADELDDIYYDSDLD